MADKTIFAAYKNAVSKDAGPPRKVYPLGAGKPKAPEPRKVSLDGYAPYKVSGYRGAILVGADQEPPEGYKSIGIKGDPTGKTPSREIYVPATEVYGDRTPEQYQAEARRRDAEMQASKPRKKVYGEKTIAREEAARQAARQRVLDRAAEQKQSLERTKAGVAEFNALAKPKQGATNPAEYGSFMSDLGGAKGLSQSEQTQLQYGVTPDRFAKQLAGVDLQTTAGLEEARKRLNIGRGQQVVPRAQRSLLDRLLGR